MAQRQNLSSLGPVVAASAGARSDATWAGGLIWLAAGLCAGYWLLQAGGQGPWVPLKGLAPGAPQADVDSVGRALGFSPDEVEASVEAAPAPQTRLRLLGVVAQGQVVGAALLAVGDQPPRPWRVGAEVVDGLVLQSVDKLGAKLGESRWGPTTLALEMPEPMEPVQRRVSQPTLRKLPLVRPQPNVALSELADEPADEPPPTAPITPR